MQSSQTKEARYQAIAFAVARRIQDKELLPGDKLRGRSVLAAAYQVSSETVRKALNLLAQANVVNVIERSGVYVKSVEAAEQYINDYMAKEAEQGLLLELENALRNHKKQLKNLENKIQKLIRSRKQAVFPFEYFAMTLSANSPFHQKTLQEANLQTQFGGLVIAVDTIEGFIQNPSPNTLLEAGMVLYILGDKTVQERSKKYE